MIMKKSTKSTKWEKNYTYFRFVYIPPTNILTLRWIWRCARKFDLQCILRTNKGWYGISNMTIFLLKKQIITFTNHNQPRIKKIKKKLIFFYFEELSEFSPYAPFGSLQSLHFRENEASSGRLSINKRIFVYFFALLNNLFHKVAIASSFEFNSINITNKFKYTPTELWYKQSF